MGSNPTSPTMKTFRGNKPTNRNGYPAVYQPDHPFSYEDGMVYVHHVVALEKYGKIPNGYHVHHKDGNKWNWDSDNLVLIEAYKHIASHNKKKKLILTCSWCDKKFKVTPSNIDRKYCSRACYDEAREKIDWPTVGALQEAVHQVSAVAVADLLGVSNVAVHKRINHR